MAAREGETKRSADVTRFEYAMLEHQYGFQRDEARLATLGADGWELVSVVASGVNSIAYFKRPLP